VPRQLTPRAVARRVHAGALCLAAAVAALVGCKVNDLGLDVTPDSGGGVDATVDRPVEAAPGDGGGRDLACGPCDSAATFITLPGGRFKGTTAAGSAGENQGSCGGASAPESVFKIELFTTSDLFITTHGTQFDTVVYLRQGACSGAEAEFWASRLALIVRLCSG